ncbi:hypothetical protein A1Q1_02896 [Trichosporon asahii var. asahii CBS 2479]|uniref:Uncharacterized protein n=1 Tax=Trichosporon asahii var. asahii (strain ATCC 90039 / CBS 2479 / JCM 2466 / KCTC 7840 / NBRC 103889/ NCYC 2677 / UAMH 7654) TaxID=1186058 RepID=J6EZA0_TRIAS|nr:hypothetical protein A1Q1_02896 [Trichosporon asahii var. asahii CBS 2479]EJT48192.1 hypothetical protein A1Q1_02896 [Trichosporon asahii var. asahii CBS 2479]
MDRPSTRLPEFDWSSMPKVDGRKIAGRAHGRYDLTTGRTSTFHEMVSGSAIERKLTFNKITATQLGTIEVNLEGGTRQLSTLSGLPTLSPAAHHTIDEKLKKYATRPVLMLKDIIPTPRGEQEEPPALIAAGTKKEKENVKVKKEKQTKKRKSAGGRSGEAGPSRIPLGVAAAPHDDEIQPLETPSKKRKIHTVDLTNDRKPPVFINLLDSDDEDEKPFIVFSYSVHIPLDRLIRTDETRRQLLEGLGDEYQVEYVAEGPTKVRVANVHIECEDGQVSVRDNFDNPAQLTSEEFGIVVQPARRPRFDWNMNPMVDGREVAGLTTQSGEISPACISTFYDLVADAVYERKLAFSKINRIEDGPILDSGTASQLGTIEVLLEAGTAYLVEGMNIPPITAAPQDTVALSSYVGGGTVVGTVEAETLAQLVPNPKIPVYKIHMTYATRPVLMLKDIIPSPAAAVEAPAPRIAGKKKRKSADAAPEAGPSRLRPEATTGQSKKRRSRLAEQEDRKPVIINLLDSDDDGEGEGEERKPIIVH